MPAGMITVQRRNGKLQSCEPCRARKMACDHKVPTCGRCLRVGRSSQCHYKPPIPTNLKRDRSHRTNASASPRSAELSDPTSPRFSLGQITGDRVSNSNASDSAGKVFFGQSSSFAAIAELNDTLGHDALCKQVDTSVAFAFKESGHWKLDIMHRLQETDRLSRLTDRWFSVRSGYLIYQPVYHIWLEEVRNTCGCASSAKSLQVLCDMVDRNTESPFSSTGPPTAQDWAYQSTGSNLRWETVGLIFCAAGLMAGSFSQWDKAFVNRDGNVENRWDLAKTMLQVVNKCIGFCREAGCCNDLLAFLLFESTLLLERVQGCSSPAAWLRMGETCDMAIMLGFHRRKQVDSATPFYLCELRIRLVQQIYSHDKFLATYLGRPSRLSYRHCAIQLAHDASDDQICSGAVESGVKLLHPSEIVNDPICHSRSFWRKLWVPHAIIREDILEIALSVSDNDLKVRVDQVRAKIEKAHKDMPAILQTNIMETLQQIRQRPSNHAFGSSVPWRPLDVLCTLGLHCGLRHTDFMLERAIIDRLTSCKDRLIATARDLLDLVLKVLQMRDYFCDFQADLVILLTYHLMPAASFLAIELLRQDQSGVKDARLPRSCLIQQLSTLVSDADLVSPDDGNYRICKIGTTAIQQVLDRLLSLPRRQEPPDPLCNFDAMADWDAFFTSSNDADALEWLDTFDFNSSLWCDDPNTLS